MSPVRVKAGSRDDPAHCSRSMANGLNGSRQMLFQIVRFANRCRREVGVDYDLGLGYARQERISVVIVIRHVTDLIDTVSSARHRHVSGASVTAWLVIQRTLGARVGPVVEALGQNVDGLGIEAYPEFVLMPEEEDV